MNPKFNFKQLFRKSFCAAKIDFSKVDFFDLKPTTADQSLTPYIYIYDFTQFIEYPHNIYNIYLYILYVDLRLFKLQLGLII